MMIVLVVLVAYAAARRRSLAVAFLSGASVPGAALLAYHWAAFGSPFSTSYRYEHPLAGRVSSTMLTFRPLDIARTLFWERGIFVLTPIVALAAAGTWVMVSGLRGERREGWTCLAVVALFALVPAVWTDTSAGYTGGNSPGPRFIVPALPFLVLPLAAAIGRWPRLFGIAAVVSVLTMLTATMTAPAVPQRRVAVQFWASRLFEHRLRSTFGISNPVGAAILWTLQLAVAALLGVLALRATRAPLARA